MTRLYLLYTVHLNGALERLPRLYTFLKHLRHQTEAEQTLLLDLGGSCNSESWHCAATGGRSMLIVLDAMGYAAVNAVGLSSESREKLRANFLAMALVDDLYPHLSGSICLRTAPDSSLAPAALEIDLRPVSQTHFDGRELRLGLVRGDQVGAVELRLAGGIPTLEAFHIHDLPPAMLPDPTISAAVDLVLAEARLHQRRLSGE